MGQNRTGNQKISAWEVNDHLFLRCKGYLLFIMTSFHRAQSLTNHFSWCFEAVVASYWSHSAKILWGYWRLLHGKASSHRSTLITNLLSKNHITLVNYSPYSPDLGPWDFYLFGKTCQWRAYVMLMYRPSKRRVHTFSEPWH